MNLTDTEVRRQTLPPGKSEAFFWDDKVPGFGLRMRAPNSRTYIVQYKIGAKNRRITLGVTTAMSAADARDKAKDIYARVRLGEDPAAVKAEAKIKATQTFGAAMGQFLGTKEGQIRPSSYADLRHGLQVHAKPLHELAVERISRADVATCLGAVEKRAGARTRNKVRGHVSAFFSWLIAEGRAETNPVIGTRRAEQKSRERVLSPIELKMIWQVLPKSDFGEVMKLLMLTGQRAEEIAGLRWSELSDDAIHLPAERTKNHRPHRIPLSTEAKDILALRKRALDDNTAEPRDLIFGTGKRGFSGWSRAKKSLNASIKEASGKPLPHWTPHDLRRTFVTHANEIGVAPHIIEQCVNHVSGHRGGVAGIYNRSTLEPEKRIAMNRWAEQLMAWVEDRDPKVQPIRKSA